MDVLHTRLLFQEVKSRFSNISTFNKELLKATAYLLLLFYFPNLGNHRIKQEGTHNNMCEHGSARFTVTIPCKI